MTRKNKRMRRKGVALASILTALALATALLVGTGLGKRADVVLLDYSVSEDGTKLTFRTAVPVSAGHIRGFKDDGGGVKPHYLTFYSAFGGPNDSLGARGEFELDLGGDDTEIYSNRPDGGDELVLQKECGHRRTEGTRPAGLQFA